MKLTPEIMLAIGFEEIKPESYRGNIRLFEFDPPKNPITGYMGYCFRVAIGDYPDTNPNSGVVSLLTPEYKDFIGGRNMILQEQQEIAIATHVTTLERLNAIYTSLTQNDPFTLPFHELEINAN